MTSCKISRPWAVVFISPAGASNRGTEDSLKFYTSGSKAYTEVSNEVLRISRGQTQATRVRVEHWEQGRWALHGTVSLEES